MVDEFAGTIIEHLPVILMKSEAASSIFEPGANGLMDSLVTFLGQEMVRFNRLLGEMKRTLEDLRKAIKGLAVMSGDLDQMYRSLLNNQVPRIWEDVAYPSLKPLGSWVQDMTKRVAFLREWLALGKPISYWMSSFFFPQGFLTAVLQSYARKYQMPIDTLSFQYEFQTFFDVKSIEETQEDGCYIHGLFMEGARWDPEANQLEDANAGEMYATAPIILFTPAQNFQPDPEEYSMPVYKTTTRAGVLDTTGHSTNFVVSIECASSRKPSYWVLKGAAFLCQLND
jgi:dynein heavy chain